MTNKSLIEIYKKLNGPPSSAASDFLNIFEKKVEDDNYGWVSVFKLTSELGYDDPEDYDIYYTLCDRLLSLNIIETKTIITSDEYRTNKIEKSEIDGIYFKNSSIDSSRNYPDAKLAELNQVSDSIYVDLLIKLKNDILIDFKDNKDKLLDKNETTIVGEKNIEANVSSVLSPGGVWYLSDFIYIIESKASRPKSKLAVKFAIKHKKDSGELIFVKTNKSREELTDYNLKKYGRHLDWLDESKLNLLLSEEVSDDYKRTEFYKVFAYIASVEKSLEKYIEDFDEIIKNSTTEVAKTHKPENINGILINEKENTSDLNHTNLKKENNDYFDKSKADESFFSESSKMVQKEALNKKIEEKSFEDKEYDHSNEVLKSENQFSQNDGFLQSISSLTKNNTSKIVKYRKMLWSTGIILIVFAIGFSYYNKQKIETSTSNIEKELNSPTSEWRLVKRKEMEMLLSEIENLKTQNAHLIAERESTIKYELDKYKSDIDKKTSEIELAAYEKGKQEAFNLEEGDFEKVAKLKLENVVVSGECEAYNDKKIGKIYPVNMPMSVVRWIVDPKSLAIAGVIGTSEEIRKNYDQRVSTVRCLLGKSDIWASNGKPYRGKDGRSLPLDKDGKPVETNPIYQESSAEN